MAGSLQDNGNVFSYFYPSPGPWLRLEGGDGVLTLFLNWAGIVASGDLIRSNNALISKDPSGALTDHGKQARAAWWADASRWFYDFHMFSDFPRSAGVIPVDGWFVGLANNVALEATLPNPNVRKNPTESVTTPGFVNEAGKLMLAVAAVGEVLYGLFPDPTGWGYHWQILTKMPHLPPLDPSGKEKDYFATATASLSGTPILVGMNTGQVFRFDAAAPLWGVTEISDSIVPSTDPIIRFAIVPAGHAFFIAGPRVYRLETDGWRVVWWEPNGAAFYALEADHSSGVAFHVFVASYFGVWESQDDGATWTDASADLPTAPNCVDLRFARESSGATFMYLGTYGWSTFRKLLIHQDVPQQVKITGYMDVVDRVLVGKDTWSHPKFGAVGGGDTFMLGPFHPVEEVEYPAKAEQEVGDEIRIVLKLRLEWKINRSVVVKYDATMYDRTEDEQIDNHTDGSFTVPVGTAETYTINMKAGKVPPNRAYIEFTVQN